MFNIKRLQSFFWEIDPGYFRLKHATKTIVAILITLLLVNNESMATKAMAGVSCAMSIQGSFAKHYFWRIGQIIFFDLLYFASFSLGLLIRDSANLKAIALVLLGFAVNYIRRFGLQTSIAPLMIWLLCFMATILPFNSSAEAWTHIHGLIIGLVVSALIMLVIFPENYRRLYIHNSNRFFKSLAQGFNEVRRYLLRANSPIDFQRLTFVRTKDSLNRLLESNQSIDQSDIFDEQQENLISELMICEYALAQAYIIMIDAYRNLRIHNHFLSKEVRLSLSVINKQLSRWFYSAQMDKSYKVSAKKIEVSFDKFMQKVNEEQITEPNLVIAVLNLNLSLRFIVQQFDKLLDSSHAN
ncbi:aromatic acid exporter family protein [Legionella hackeliae]|uniref:FUSC family protein n=1 Tax=Legionella hackeliae TaxID=449 RepID=A0A0A8UVZ3_LEGHA|nr:hypothetical protein [Legionella hackeliae]KTD10026.1 hypothetical protein Lhac_2394 [Legionella hackeliae]CEK11671.1 membrane protein of unknown function [Legionella hackeliae]STX48439.1 Predicted membrane protein [Legionella hackeliae]